MGTDSPNLEQKRASMEKIAQEAASALQARDYAKAERSFSSALELARTLSDRGAEAEFLSYLGVAKKHLGEVDLARRHLEESIQIAHEFGLMKLEAHSCTFLAEQEQDNGLNAQAIERYLQALEASYHIGDLLGMEIAFGNVGLLYLERGWAEQAAEWFRHALEIREDSPFKATWLCNLGLAFAELGQLEMAIENYQLANQEAVTQGDQLAQSVCTGMQGNAHFEMNNLQQAIKCYDEALHISRENEDWRRIGIWLGNIGNAWLKLNDVQKAIANCSEAEEIARRIGDVQSQAAHLDSLGDCYAAKGELNLALDKYQQATELSSQIQDRLGERIYLSNLGRAYQELGQLQPAFELFSKAIELFDEQRAAIRADDLKTSFANRGQELYRDMVKVCLSIGKRVEALEYVGRAKSRALLDLLSNSPIDISQLDADTDESLRKIIQREQELRNQIAHFERLFWQGPPAGDSGHRGATLAPEQSHKIYADWRETINQLRRRHPNYASLVAAGTLSFGEIASLWETYRGDTKQHLLSRRTAIVEYYWTDHYLMAASVWYGVQQPVVHYISDVEQIAALESDLSSFMEMSATEGWEVPASLCKRLFTALLQPVLAGLPDDVDRLLIIPHGSLYHLPFAALHDGKGFLCQKYSISYIPTTSLIPVLARDRSSGQDGQSSSGYLISAISDYSATRQGGLAFSARLRSAAGLDDLSYTMEEASTIYDLRSTRSPEARLVTNEQVKEALPALFSKYPIVHFAGHAVFNPEEPLASGLVLADGSILSAAAILQGNVLHTNCGRLLVLSACQTGVNMVTAGGEILGLARALMYAGMPNLVLSLWEVADRSTAMLMQDFHRFMMDRSNREDSLHIADALRAAQESAALSGQPVHAWAPFIHLGIE